MNGFKIELSIFPCSPFFTSGTGHSLPLADRTVMRDADGMPYIPASSIRGRARAYVERLLISAGEPVCRPPRQKNMCPHNLDVAKALLSQAQKETLCVSCRIFGSVWHQSRVIFSDLKLKGEEASYTIRQMVSLDRRLNTAVPERLFSTEVFEPDGAVFSGIIEGHLEQRELAWLIAGVLTISHIGGGKARGMGLVKTQVSGLQMAGADGQLKNRDWTEIVREGVHLV